MSVEIRVPSLGESVTERPSRGWFKQIGDPVAADEPLVELETDKVTLEFNAPASGVLAEIAVEEGGEVEVGALLGSISRRRRGGASSARAGEASAAGIRGGQRLDGAGGAQADRRVRPGPVPDHADRAKGNITKGDVLAAIEAGQAGRARPRPRPATPTSRRRPPSLRPRRSAGVRAESAAAPTPAARPAVTARPQPAPPAERKVPHAGRGREERVRMTRLRRRIAERLKEAQNTAAILTTYNEADLGAVMELRKRYRDSFEKKHGVRLGFMSFFVKASINARRHFRRSMPRSTATRSCTSTTTTSASP